MQELATTVSAELAGTLAAWAGTKSPRTVQEYSKALTIFARFVGAPSGAEALAQILAGRRGRANRVVESWKAQMLQSGLSSETVNQRLHAVKSAVEAARKHEIVDWKLDVADVKVERRSPQNTISWEDYERMVAAEPSARNVAILRALGDRALRRNEVATLRFEDFPGFGLGVLGKGRRERETLSVNDRTREAVFKWIAERGKAPGSLFGLSPNAVWRVVRAAGARVGVKGARPHLLRHASATRALDLTNGDVRRVQRFMRHVSPATTMIYDDKRENHATAVAKLLGKE